MSNIVRLQNCGNCKFGDPPGPDGLVECKRFPPAVVMVPTQRAPGQVTVMPAAIFPRLTPTLHCGEHKPRIIAAIGENNVIDFSRAQNAPLDAAA